MDMERSIPNARWRKFAMLAAVLGLALLTGACSSDDSSGGGGGGSGYAPPPSARPTFTGMTISMNLSGGSATAGSGGGGGSLNSYVVDGSLSTGSGGSREALTPTS